MLHTSEILLHCACRWWTTDSGASNQ